MNKVYMDFSEALLLMKHGFRIGRAGWNGNNMFLYYVSADRYPAKMDAAAYIADEVGMVEYGAYIALKTEQDYVVPWTASQTDILSTDWMVVE